MRKCFTSVLVLSGMATAFAAKPRCIMYFTAYHNTVPEASLVADVTHVSLAFMKPSAFNDKLFNDKDNVKWPLFTTVEDARKKFAAGTRMMVATGGWGDTEGFSVGAKTDESRKLFAKNVKKMINDTGADGIDIDWEYAGGNGEDYKKIPNSEKAWEIDAYPLLLKEIRQAIGPEKLMSAAVPGLPRDMLAFNAKNMPEILKYIDFFNVMTYDMMNRRDNVTKHHTGVQLSLQSIDTYIGNGVPPEKINLGFAYYAKWFKTDPKGGCDVNPIGCKTVLMEDPKTGADLGQSGSITYPDAVPAKVAESWKLAQEKGVYDDKGGGHYYWDAKENTWWTWDTPAAISKKFPEIVQKKKLGGVFAWGLGEDANKFDHLKATIEGVKTLGKS